MCGSLTVVQRGQMLRADAVRRQLLARPARTFALDFFFLGTAIWGSTFLGVLCTRSEQRIKR